MVKYIRLKYIFLCYMVKYYQLNLIIGVSEKLGSQSYRIIIHSYDQSQLCVGLGLSEQGYNLQHFCFCARFVLRFDSHIAYSILEYNQCLSKINYSLQITKVDNGGSVAHLIELRV